MHGSPLVVSEPVALSTAILTGQHREKTLVGQVERNQGLPTFTGRLTLDEFLDLTVVHNRKWAEEAGESLDTVTQRELIDGHANDLAIFIMQGLVSATILRATQSGFPASLVERLEEIKKRIGWSAHFGLPQVTLVLPVEPEIRMLSDSEGTIGARMKIVAGRRFIVADGQHRREAARRVREFLNDVISNQRTPKAGKIYPAQDAPLKREEVEAWVAVQETFTEHSTIAFEAHIGLTVEQAKQMFTNYNCNVKPVKKDLSLEFDKANPINRFAKEWLHDHLAKCGVATEEYDLRALASVNGFLFMGKTTIKSAPFDISLLEPKAREFWTTVTSAPDWGREGTLLREIPLLKGLAKTWFQVFLAKRNGKLSRATALRQLIVNTRFDDAWVDTVKGLPALMLPGRGDAPRRFAPTHNDIVAKIVAHVLD